MAHMAAPTSPPTDRTDDGLTSVVVMAILAGAFAFAVIVAVVGATGSAATDGSPAPDDAAVRAALEDADPMAVDVFRYHAQGQTESPWCDQLAARDGDLAGWADDVADDAEMWVRSEAAMLETAIVAVNAICADTVADSVGG